MNTISERILFIIEDKKLTKTEFASKLNVTQPYISKIINKGSTPSDRLLKDICRKFDVREEWLINGTGDIYIELSKDEYIVDFVTRILKDKDDSFKKRYISMLSKLDEDGWTALEKVASAIGALGKD